MARIPQRRRYNHSRALDGRIPPLTASQRTISTRTFHLFPNLPREIRQIIWELALLEPRIVEVDYYTASNGSQRYPSKSVVPAPLHVCSFSREIGLRHYERFMPLGVWTGTYVNWDHDYISPIWSMVQFSNHIGAITEWITESDLTEKTRHVLLRPSSPEWQRYMCGRFHNCQDFALLRGVEYGDGPAGLTELAPDADHEDGGPMQLFDILETDEGPVAQKIQCERKPLFTEQQKQTILEKSEFAHVVEYKELILMAPYHVTPVLGFQRKRPCISVEEMNERKLEEEQLRKDFPPPTLPDSHCKTWLSHELDREFFRFRYDILGQYGEDHYEDAELVAMIDGNLNKCMLFEYERFFRHYLMEVRENARGRGLTDGQTGEPEAEDEDEYNDEYDDGRLHTKILSDYEESLRRRVMELIEKGKVGS